MAVDLGNAAELVADGIAALALVASVVLPWRAEKRQREFRAQQQQERLTFQEDLERKEREAREEFEKEQLRRVEASERRIAEFQSVLRRSEAVNAKLLSDLERLEPILGEVFAKFENLLHTSRTAKKDDVLVQACRESLQPLTRLQKAVDRLKLVLVPRHHRALERLETMLVTIFLYVRRVSDERDEQYVAEIRRYEARLVKYNKLTNLLITAIYNALAGAPKESTALQSSERQ